jgi:hypothetical protein
MPHMIVMSIVIAAELFVVLAFVFILRLLKLYFYCKLLIYTEECKFVVSIMNLMVIIPAREPMVWDLAAQSSDGKLTSSGPPISIRC